MNINFEKPDTVTGNHPDDKDYQFFRSRGMMTIEAQQRNASQLDKRDAQHKDGDWFKNSSVGY